VPHNDANFGIGTLAETLFSAGMGKSENFQLCRVICYSGRPQPTGEALGMNRLGMLTMTIAALLLLGMAPAAVAATKARKYDQCYGLCEAKCGAQYGCGRTDARRDCFTNFNKCKAVCRASCPR
ncbi:MAG: hypothetical protein WBW74_17300, partial [Xanthobacteraceae bacterium]